MAASMSTVIASFAATKSRVYCKQLTTIFRLHHGAAMGPHHEKRTHTLTATHISKKFTGSLHLHKRSFSTEISHQLEDPTIDQTPEETLLTIKEKPKGYLAWKPVDDVYLRMHYPPQLQTFQDAMETLRKQDKWMFCRRKSKHEDRTVTISMNLDMALQKKKKVEPFQGVVLLPHPFKSDNRILCFARGTDEQNAIDAGADIVSDETIVPKVLSRKIKNYDYCVSTPDMMPELVPLKRLLRKKYPSSKRGSVGLDLRSMIHRYKKGQEYKCQIKWAHVNVSIGKLSLTNEQLEENMQCVITDVSKHKPAEFSPLITKITLNAFLLDGVALEFEKYLPKREDEFSAMKSSQEPETKQL
ncbi:large ribosomal subunit protein uL1m-like isoform X2 [Asterias amurensis]|uniref:large ribosomal subunit protein uL1m-like isoform X2 n=1 Tax=Asterias amurensis TaxID=7602 RepID=UPI003AB50233